MKKKPKIIQVLQTPLCPYWRYDCGDGSVAIYIPNGDAMTMERANTLLDMAKIKLLQIRPGDPEIKA